MIHNEDTFQQWVKDRLIAVGAHVQDFSAHGGDVPDLSAALLEQEYWLELKYGVFKLLHTKYDEFFYRETKRGQLAWLCKRQEQSTAICGILGYAMMQGNHSSTPYITFHSAHYYLAEVWTRVNRWCAGSVILSQRAAPAHSLLTGRALLDFIARAADRTPRNAQALSG